MTLPKTQAELDVMLNAACDRTRSDLLSKFYRRCVEKRIYSALGTITFFAAEEDIQINTEGK